MSKRRPAIGIDFGTSFSRVAVFRNGKAEIIPTDRGSHQTPSCVAFTKSGRLVGEAAVAQADVNPSNTIFGMKRLIGAEDYDSWVLDHQDLCPFSVDSGDGSLKVPVDVRGTATYFSPVELSSMVFSVLKSQAEAYLGEPVVDVVLAVPSGFDTSQRRMLKDAASIAGLNVVRMIHDSTATAISYGIHHEVGRDQEQNILVIDLGGGVLSVSIVCIEDCIYEVKSTACDTHLGGEDFDERIMNNVLQELQMELEDPVDLDDSSKLRLRRACVNAKLELSTATEARVNVQSLSNCPNFVKRITRADFNKLCADLFQSITVETVQNALRDARMDASSIVDVVLVGGSTKIPKIRQLLMEFFNGKELKIFSDADQAVAFGAAVEAAALAGDPSEFMQKYLLLDVTSHSLGVELPDGKMERLIKRNSTIPTKHRHTFLMPEDGQTEFVVKVYEGESDKVEENKLLGALSLTDLMEPPKGTQHEIEVTFDMDANGTLKVTAQDKVIGKQKQVTVVDGAGNVASSRSGGI